MFYIEVFVKKKCILLFIYMNFEFYYCFMLRFDDCLVLFNLLLIECIVKLSIYVLFVMLWFELLFNVGSLIY